MGRRARVSRDDVLRASREAFAERGYHGATLADIAGRLGVSPAALLRHEAGKKELFEAAMASPAAADPFPLDFLRDADPRGDPGPVLRRLAYTAIPFLERVMAENIARWLFANTAAEAAHAPARGDHESQSGDPGPAGGRGRGYVLGLPPSRRRGARLLRHHRGPRRRGGLARGRARGQGARGRG